MDWCVLDVFVSFDGLINDPVEVVLISSSKKECLLTDGDEPSNIASKEFALPLRRRDETGEGDRVD